ncbi:MAG: hypothetical protein IH863_01005 [Chloroflexi bacterium]|nr:hypothetical protein [Chloroflexota bacterium]
MISHLSYRARQLRRTLAPGITADDLREAESALGGDLYALFAAMQPADQRHCLDVYHRLRNEGQDDPHLLAAALIHDAGKGGEAARRIRTWHRVAYVILGALPPGALDRIARGDGGLARLHHHGEATLQLVRGAGASQRIAALLEVMEAGERADPHAARLLAADDAC